MTNYYYTIKKERSRDFRVYRHCVGFYHSDCVGCYTTLSGAKAAWRKLTDEINAMVVL